MLTQNNHPTFINPPYPELKYACVPHIVSLTSILIERQLLVPFFVCSPIIYPFWFTEWLYTFHYTLHFNAIRCRQNSAYVTSHAKYTVNQNDVAHHWGFNASFNKSTQTTTKKAWGKRIYRIRLFCGICYSLSLRAKSMILLTSVEKHVFFILTHYCS